MLKNIIVELVKWQLLVCWMNAQHVEQRKLLSLTLAPFEDKLYSDINMTATMFKNTQAI